MEVLRILGFNNPQDEEVRREIAPPLRRAAEDAAEDGEDDIEQQDAAFC
jgi:hypothetical protein